MPDTLAMPAADPSAERRAVARATRRLLPLLLLLHFAAYLDRVNVSFAALTMNADLGIGPALFGRAAGVFFIGYCLVEIPSNLILAKVGARRWIARIMVTWGIVSACMALVSGPAAYMALRFALGVAEAGFFPGIILYLTLWFPAAERARAATIFLLGVPVSVVLGAPLSGALLGLDGWLGLHGWQWLFIAEGAPAILLGIAAWRLLPDTPGSAAWLPPDEARALQSRLDAERGAARPDGASWRVMADAGLLTLGVAYLLINIGVYGLVFWLPQILKTFGFGDMATSLLVAVPWVLGSLSAIVWSRHSDQTRERVIHAGLPGLLGAAGLAASAFATSPATAVLAFCVGVTGFIGIPVFWTLVQARAARTSAPAGIAFVNVIANFAGLIGPTLVGQMRENGGSYHGAILALAGCLFAGSLVILTGRRAFRDPLYPLP